MAAEIGTSIRKVQTPDGVIHPIHDERIPAVDTIPTANSANPVTSGGVYAELADVVRQEDMERLTTTEITNLLDL